ncbi:MAG: hypothetical protein Q8K75_05985 [Chlamydiales bacterium]|nr:hypothetical protein [Chlamydiales bacterium]
MELPIISGAFGQVSSWLGYKKPTPPPPPPSIVERIWICMVRALYTVVDAADRIRSSSDGLDKTLKLACGLSVGMMMLPDVNTKYWGWLSKELKYIDGVFSAFAVFGRYNEFVKVDDKGKPLFMKGHGIESTLKNTNVAFLAASKTCEFGRLLNTVGLMSTEGLLQADTQYLGGMASRIGGSTVFGRAAFSAGLAGCKDFFLVIACVFSIVNNSITIVNWKDTFGTSRAAISIGADAGKIYLATAAFALSYAWVAIAILTAVFGLTKILMDSYKNKGAITFPDWMNPQWVRA